MKLLISLIATICCYTISAQDSSNVKAAVKDTSWKTTGYFGLNASQTALYNWQGGGQENVAANAILNGEAVYKKGKTTWLNKLDAQYGIIKLGTATIYDKNDRRRFRKNIDQLFALSKLNIDAFAKNWFYTAQADFRTNMAPGYNYVGDTVSGPATSDFLSPAYIQLAIGLDYKPVPYFSAFIAPAAGKITMVNRQYLADAGAYGVNAAKFDDSGNMIQKGEKVRFEFGGRIVLKFKKDLAKNVNLDSYLDLFSNYSQKPENIDVVFNNLLTVKIAKYITLNIITQMIYDDDIIIRKDKTGDGLFDDPKDINGPRLQLLNTTAIGFGYKF